MRVTNETSPSKPDVIVGTPLCRRTSFVLDKLLSNQREIQQAYPDCRLVLATDEPDFVAELKQQIKHYRLKGEVIAYKTVRPDYARSRLWSITCGREAIRKYALSQEVKYLLFVDGDVVFEPTMLSILKDRIRGYDVLWSGYRFPPKGDLRFAAGCLMINHNILSKIPFRCCEFSNNEIIFEDELFDAGLFKHRARVNKGIFLFAKHYASRNEYVATEPQKVSWFRKLTNSQLVRFLIVTASLAIRHNIPGKLHTLLYRAPGSSAKLFAQTKSEKKAGWE
jgi:hypothetical protein